jgi:L-ribulokinase
MNNRKYSIGIDFETESARAVLVDVTDGREIASSVHKYASDVIDEFLPGSNVKLEPDWVLQDPNDYLDVFKQPIPAVLRESGFDPVEVIGLGTDFTTCTMMPTKAEGMSLCFLPEWRDNPHTWVKLWKQHATQVETSIYKGIIVK